MGRRGVLSPGAAVPRSAYLCRVSKSNRLKTLIYVLWPVKAWSIPDEKVDVLRETFPDIDFIYARSLDEAKAAIVDVDTTLTPFLTAEMVASAPRLSCVHSPAAAIEGLLPSAVLAARGITVSNSRGVQAVPIAEHVMGGLLVLSHKFDRMIDAQRERRWIQNDLFVDVPWMLAGKRMTIVGLGTIGLEVAKRAHAFGMKVTGVRRHAERPAPAEVERVVGTDQLDDALRGCDVLVLSAPGVAGTQGMIGARELALLNPGAVLVNVARAQIVDGGAMRAALASGQLGGAVVDVFEKEPLNSDDALWSTPNVIVTPHSSGFRATHWDAVTELFVDNMRRYQKSQPLENVVDLAAGY
jgi:phosphoglycerate dehydrogenase-like enzyme